MMPVASVATSKPVSQAGAVAEGVEVMGMEEGNCKAGDIEGVSANDIKGADLENMM